jgi:hypothetical protein
LSVRINSIEETIGSDEEASLSVTVNEPDLSKLKFEWFKLNKFKTTRQEEAIKLEDNPTAHSQVLTIKKLSEKDVGDYKCQVTRASTNEKVMSSSCHLKLARRSECNYFLLIFYLEKKHKGI